MLVPAFAAGGGGDGSPGSTDPRGLAEAASRAKVTPADPRTMSPCSRDAWRSPSVLGLGPSLPGGGGKSNHRSHTGCAGLPRGAGTQPTRSRSGTPPRALPPSPYGSHSTSHCQAQERASNLGSTISHRAGTAATQMSFNLHDKVAPLLQADRMPLRAISENYLNNVMS